MVDPVGDVVKNKILKPVALVLAICIYFGCADNNQKIKNQPLAESVDSTYRKIDFEKFIIEQKDDSLDFYGQLLGDKKFVSVFEHSKFYLDDVMSFLNKGNYNSMQVCICICAMQNLGVRDYVRFCTYLLSLYNNGEISEGVLETGIAPNLLQKRIIIDNYNNSEVKRLLKTIQANKSIKDSSFLVWLPNIISGKSSKELKEFDKESGAN